MINKVKQLVEKFQNQIHQNQKLLFKNKYREAIEFLNTDFKFDERKLTTNLEQIEKFTTEYRFFVNIKNIYFSFNEPCFKEQDLISKEISDYLDNIYLDERNGEREKGTYIDEKQKIITDYHDFIIELETLKLSLEIDKKNENIKVPELESFFKKKENYEKLLKCLIDNEVIDDNFKLLPQILRQDIIAIFCLLYKYNYIQINRNQNKLCDALSFFCGEKIDEGKFSKMKKEVENENNYKTPLSNYTKNILRKYEYIHDYIK
ncbi:hypothetical protein SAMN05443543_107135 [Flavobacterium flevense]|uniref:Uncharacterized protein n=1 Tax=Flavobacterium flevense TaxID=983 RepID=A0A4Y4AXV5_9FLAO|nr:hypothetical protein [Flavobacterium flevense]GEC72149.1 hypothetical protein FFL01_16880 [Flavobacterium flevense]SHL93894.1 hypothetical protein SAMN05443543_107135 [Flavobacterium flevense]